MAPPKRVLLVDDDADIREMTTLLLRSSGFESEAVPAGPEGLERVRSWSPDVVLLDINMPGMSGWEVLRLLKEDDETAAVPVIMFSVNFEIREKLHALQQGAVDYVTKPFDTEALVRRVHDIAGPAAAEAR